MEGKYNFSIPIATHQVSVRSKTDNKDSKTFSITADIELEKLYIDISGFLKKEIQGGTFRQDLVLENKMARRNSPYQNNMENMPTHVIVILPKSGQHSKSFSINIPNFSSEEIAREIMKLLCGGRCSF